MLIAIRFPIKNTFKVSICGDKCHSQSAHSLTLAKNGDFIIGGERYLSPWVMRLDSAGNIKWAAWYYDSPADGKVLICKACYFEL